MRALIFDPFAGISGDMTLGALIDLGLPESWLVSFVRSLNLARVEVRVDRTARCGLACPHVVFELPAENAHRHLRHILEILERAPISAGVRDKARNVFHRLAEAEAEVHGTTPEKVHFHEVGALDSILDVLCVLAGLEHLGFEAFYSRPVAVGHGWIEIAHGRFPVPAPATLKLLNGFELTGADLEGECTTPTGAALLATLTGGRRAPAAFMAGRTGYGAGTRNPADRPNCLRLIEAEVPVAQNDLFILQTDIDDLSPEYAPAALDALMAAGALDATLSAVQMKKGRPGLRLEALVPAGVRDAVLDAVFRNTPSIGARYWPVTRPALPRSETIIVWRGQEIRVKRVTLPGGRERTKPEYEDVVRAAAALGIPALDVLRGIGHPDAT